MKRFLLALFTFASINSIAGQSPGVWYGSSSDSTISTYVSNEDGSTLSFVCHKSDRSCVWGLSVMNPCSENKEQPVLGTSVAGASHLTLICLGRGESSSFYSYFLKEYEQMFSLTVSGGVLGIAVPLEGGEFTAHRFNVDGAKAAIESVAKALNALNPTKKPTGLGSNTF